jgi:hypothetical protein
MLKSLRLMLVLSLLVPFAHDAAGRTPEPTPTSRPSFKSGFSSQRQAPAPAPSYKPRSSSGSASGGFGSFSSQRSAPPPDLPPAMPAPDRAGSRNGGFGSFNGGGADSAHRSESATSRQLSRRQAEENALRTLEESRAREAARTAQREPERNSDRDSRPGQYERDQRDQPNYRDYRAPAPSYPPDVARQGGGGLGNVVAGAVIANAINRHANASNNTNNGNNAGNRQAAPDSAAPGNDWGLGPKDGHVAGNATGTGTAGGKATPGNGGQAGGASFARVFLWLCLLALLAAAGYFLWRRVRRKRDADKPNYSFERN